MKNKNAEEARSVDFLTQLDVAVVEQSQGAR